MTAPPCLGISIVVPSFNHGRFIEQTIDSLLEQDYGNLEVIVVDGQSTDDTRERIRKYEGRIRWISEPDQGQSDALRKGFALATRPWLGWLNSDDVQCDRALWRVATAIGANPGVDVIVGRGHYMDEGGTFLRPYPTIDVGVGDLVTEIFERGYMPQPSVFFSVDSYRRVGGINASLRYCMDYELWLRLAMAGAKFAAIDEDLSGNRWHAEAKTASQLLDLLGEVAATQRRLVGRVAPFYVQGISDLLYQTLRATHFGNTRHLFWRVLYFKALWVCLNAGSPLYCAKGLFTAWIAKSGPVEGDTLTAGELARGFLRLLWSPRGPSER
jgi:glycosyltransferase involved in cell wall biosynthesis